MRRRVIAVVVLGALVAGGCADGDGSVLSSATTTVPDDPTTTTDGDELPEPPPGGDECGDPPVWVLERTDDPSDDPADPSDPSSDDPEDPADPSDPADGGVQPSDDNCGEPQPEPEPELGTGDVQVTLRWTSSADLDLHVIEPDGTEIWFGDKGPTATGGRLDVDSNVGCAEDGSVENVFWPEGDMPLGEYQVEIVGFTVDGCGGGDYTLTAQVRGEEILDESGSVAEDEEDPYSFEVS